MCVGVSLYLATLFPGSISHFNICCLIDPPHLTPSLHPYYLCNILTLFLSPFYPLILSFISSPSALSTLLPPSWHPPVPFHHFPLPLLLLQSVPLLCSYLNHPFPRILTPSTRPPSCSVNMSPISSSPATPSSFEAYGYRGWRCLLLPLRQELGGGGESLVLGAAVTSVCS